MAKGDIYFDSDKALLALKQEMLSAANDCMDYVLQEIRGGMNTVEGAADVDDGTIMQLKDMISGQVISGVHAILDSFGTGSKMDKTNPTLSNYMSSEYWNPARVGYTIVGRPKGSYTDIFGETHISSGKMQGKNIEGFVEPIEPSYAIQWAEQKIKEPNGYIQRRIFYAVDSVFGQGRGSRFFGNR